MASFHKILADGFFVASFVAAFLALVGWQVSDILLASSQWLMVAIFLLLVAIYVKLSAEEDEKIIKQYKKEKK